MSNKDSTLHTYLNGLLKKGFYATLTSKFVKVEIPVERCIATHMHRVLTRMETTVNFHYEDGSEAVSFLGGSFSPVVEVLLDDDGSVYEVREDIFYEPETIKLTHTDADFDAIVQVLNDQPTEVYYDIINKLMHGTPFQLIVRGEKGNELMSWGDYCNYLDIPADLLEIAKKVA